MMLSGLYRPKFLRFSRKALFLDENQDLLLFPVLIGER
jgi:hypothetical protein